jgi:carbon-monoxide dehydrogenase large subunit
MTTNARALLGCPPTDDVDFHDDTVWCRTHSDRCLPFADLSLAVYRHGLSRPGMEDSVLEVTKTDYPRNLHHAPDEFGRFSTYPSYPYSAHITLVRLDHETGRVAVLEYFVVDDCGVIISPTFVNGQIYGAVAQGIGGALWEETPYDEQGSPTATTLKHYLLPRANDLPTIHVEHQQTPSPYTLLGTKGAGESGVGGAMAAIVNAVNDALIPFDVRVHQLPLSPPTILAAISERGHP